MSRKDFKDFIQQILKFYKKPSTDQTLLDVVNQKSKILFATRDSIENKMASLFSLVDQQFFDGFLVDTLLFLRIKIIFSTTQILNSNVAGQTSYTYGRNHIWFALNQKLFDELFQNPNNQYNAGGIVCKNQMNCFFNIFVHEICHIFVYLYREVYQLKTWSQRSHGQMFKVLITNVFHQTDMKHALIPGFTSYADTSVVRRLATQAYQQEQDMEFFEDGRWFRVKIIRVKRIFATVSSQQGIFDVPISLLRPLS